MPRGRPTSYSDEKADIICERLALGESLKGICETDGLPCQATVFNWIATRPDFLEKYRRAREAQADAFFDDLLTIADDGRNDWMKRLGKDGQSLGWVENGEALRRSALRIEARKWMAAKIAPKKYGEKVETTVTGANGGPIETRELSTIEAARMIAFALAKGEQALIEHDDGESRPPVETEG